MERLFQLLPKDLKQFKTYFVYAMLVIVMVALVYVYNHSNASKDSEVANRVRSAENACSEKVAIITNERDYLREENKDYKAKLDIAIETIKNLIESKENVKQLNQIRQ